MDIHAEDIKRSIESLIRLQEIDGKLFTLKHEAETVPPEMTKLQGQRAEAQNHLKVADKGYRDVERERRALELRSLTLQEDMKRAEARKRELRATKEEFGAGKDVENLQKKIADVKTSLDERTAAAAQKLQVKETKQKEVSEFEAKLKELEDQRKAKIAELDQAKQTLVTQRDQYISQVDDEIFSLYERVQKLRRGNGIALLKGLICQGCHVSIPPQTRHRLEGMTEIITCPSCSRILYPDSEPEQVSAAS